MITVILTAYNRPHTLDQQVAAIRQQTAKVADIWLWYNQGEKPQVKPKDPKVKTVVCSANFKFHGRFALALLARTPYVAIFDDDVIPGKRWLENCLNTMKKQPGVLGASGVLLHRKRYHPSKKVGWNGSNLANITEVDLVGHAWFFKQEWAQYLWREQPVSRENGEDIQFSYLCQKYGKIGTFVPPHPPGQQELWGNVPACAQGWDSDAQATFKKVPNHLKLRDQIVISCMDAGWRPLYVRQAKAVKAVAKPKAAKAAPTLRTTDDHSYYQRHNPDQKAGLIGRFVREHPAIQRVYDVGCNNGNLSAPLLALGKEVLGVDLSDNLQPPKGYPFRQRDVVSSPKVHLNDCTLFLSLYHHLLGKHGLAVADRVFFQLLLRTDYLIFDTGNVSESQRAQQPWYQAQRKHFASEAALLEHFGLPFETLGSWNVAGGQRQLVVFQRKDFDRAAKVTGTFQRLVGSENCARGLLPKGKSDKGKVFDSGTYHRLQLGNLQFFAKKYTAGRHAHIAGDDKSAKWQRDELNKIVEVYGQFPAAELTTFYGRSEKFGLLYAWLDQFEYVKKIRNETIHGVHLHDADLITVNGQRKYIDFWVPSDNVWP
ncbi:MAG: glycosyltransferase [Bacteroidota bacterium]